MSTLIKGMKVPKCCSDCPFNPSSLYCSITHSEIDRDDEFYDKLPDCPIVELPEHHGRLIDEQEIRNGMNQILTQPQRPTWNDTYNAIQEMDAVIEAE